MRRSMWTWRSKQRNSAWTQGKKSTWMRPTDRATKSTTGTRCGARAPLHQAEADVLRIGEGFEGSGANAAHVNLLLGTRAFLGAAFAAAAANPGPGHIPFQVVLKPNLPVKPVTLFVAKAVLRNERHERFTWGPAQAGVAAGLTRALLEDVFP